MSIVMSDKDYQKEIEDLKKRIAEFNVWYEIKVNSPLNGIQPLFALLGWDDVRTLEGKLLTIMDASTPDLVQRKAIKDLVRQTIWWHWVPHLDTCPDSQTGGMPVE